MAAYNIYEAKTSFSTLVGRAEQGEEITIARAGKPVAKLVPLSVERHKEAGPNRRRPAPGFAKEMGWDVPALLKALDEPWSEEEQRAFGMID